MHSPMNRGRARRVRAIRMGRQQSATRAAMIRIRKVSIRSLPFRLVSLTPLRSSKRCCCAVRAGSVHAIDEIPRPIDLLFLLFSVVAGESVAVPVRQERVTLPGRTVEVLGKWAVNAFQQAIIDVALQRLVRRFLALTLGQHAILLAPVLQ